MSELMSDLKSEPTSQLKVLISREAIAQRVAEMQEKKLPAILLASR